MKKFTLTVILLLVPLYFPVSSAAAEKPAIIFIIDVSGSMQGGKLQSTKDAVIQVTNNFKSDQPIGIVSFNQTVTLAQSPTTNHELIKEKILQLKAGGETSLFDAVNFTLGLNVIGGVNQIILLGDGEDTKSKLDLNTLLPKITQEKIMINSIGVQVTDVQGQVLQDISKASGGQYFAVDDISLLIDAYKRILQNEIRPVKTIPTKSASKNKGQTTLINYVFGVITSILVFTFLINIRRQFLLRKARENRMKSLLRYSGLNSKQTKEKLKTLFRAYSFVPKKIENSIKKSLDAIHSNLKYETVVNLIFVGWFVGTLFMFLLAKNIFIAAFFSAVATFYGYKVVISNTLKKHSDEFDADLPEMLNLLSSALRSGLSLNQGLEAYVADSNNEVSRQIRRANSEIKLGTPMDEALLSVANRMKSEDLKWAVTALSIQRVVGGSMANILTTTYETIKSRSEIRREVRTLSAEGRLSAYVLMALPIGIFIFLLLTRREYAMVFFTNPLGIFLLLVAFVMLAIGWRWMKSIVNIKI